jgi:transglutaminase-like putative cysteine protease
MGRLFVAIFLFIANAGAQTAPVNREESRRRIPSVTTTALESSLPSVFELWRTRYYFESDGSGRKEVIAKIRILSEMGTLQQAEQVFEYHPLSEELQIPYVRVRKQDETVVSVETNVVQPVPAGVTPDSDLDERKVRIPGLAVGDSVEYEVVTMIHRPLGPGEFCVQYSFEPSGVFNEQLEVNVPMDREVKLKSIPNVKFWTTVGARKVYHWQNQSTNALQAIEIPYIPGRTPDVQVSSFSSWEEVGHWYSNLEKNHRVPTADVKAKADELTKGSKNDLEKAEVLYNFAARRIKYFSLVSFGIGGSEPHSASETLHNTYGDCKDKTALLEALLEAEGMHASSVLISGDRNLDPEFPSPWPFDHVITILEIGSDKIWLDPSSPVLPFKMLAYPLRGKQALVLSLEGPPHLEKTPTEAPVPNIWSEEIEAKVGDNGTLEATVIITARGDAELPLRQAFLLLAPSMRPTGVQGAVMGIDRSDKISDVNISDPTQTNDPFILSFHLTKRIFIPVWEKEWNAKLPLSDCRLDALGGYSARWDDGDSSNLRLGPPRECDYKVRIEFSPKFKTVPPNAIVLQNDFASYRAHSEIEGNTLTVSRTLNTYKDELPSSLATDYEAFGQRLLTDSAVVVTVVNQGPASQK